MPDTWLSPDAVAGLDPRFDISEIAAPYARNLLLEAKPQIARLQKDVQRRFSEQVWDLLTSGFYNSAASLMRLKSSVWVHNQP